MEDKKIISVLEVDRTRDVLIDGQTLFAVSPHLATATRLSEIKGRNTIYGFIQAAVLFDRLLVDADIFKVSEPCREMFYLFQELLTQLNIEPETKWRALNSIRSIPESDYDLTESGISFFKNNCRSVASFDDEKLHYYDRACSLDFKRGERTDWQWLPDALRNSSASFFRAHYYFELSKELNIYLSPTPGRANYYRSIKNKFINLVNSSPQYKILDRADSVIVQNQTGIVDIDLTLPPVVDLVMRVMKEYRYSLLDAIYFVRNAKNTKCFREKCSELISIADNGRAAISEIQKIRRETEEFCQEWAKDINEGVIYKSRTLTVSALPTCMAKLLPFDLKVEKRIKDKVLHFDGNKRYLLFVNDLYRSAKRF